LFIPPREIKKERFARPHRKRLTEDGSPYPLRRQVGRGVPPSRELSSNTHVAFRQDESIIAAYSGRFVTSPCIKGAWKAAQYGLFEIRIANLSPESCAFNAGTDMAYFLRYTPPSGGRRLMQEFNANTERSSTVGQRQPLFKWIVLLCVLLLAVLALQVMILSKTNKLAVERQSPAAKPQVSLAPLVAHPMENPQPPTNANITAQSRRQPRDNWPSQMDVAFNDAQRMFDRMDSTFANAFHNMRRADPFTHFDDGWDRLVTSPAMDMREQGNKYVVLCYLPTVSPSNVSVTINGRMLTVCSTVSQWDGRTAQTSSFESRVQIPGPVGDIQQAAASLSNGVLKIIIPKGSAAALPANQIVKLL
jgi:HSP20 family molecular chaperone IbpA